MNDYFSNKISILELVSARPGGLHMEDFTNFCETIPYFIETYANKTGRSIEELKQVIISGQLSKEEFILTIKQWF
jgi:hypothetical protein